MSIERDALYDYKARQRIRREFRVGNIAAKMFKFVAFLAVVFVFILAISQPSHASTGLYVSGGLEAHTLQHDCPEYCGSNPLGHFGMGYTFAPNDGLYIDVYVKHLSSIPDFESGYGQNSIGVQGRWYPN